MRTLLRHLFDFEAKETTGGRLFYRLFELVLVLLVVRYAWRWGWYMLRIEDAAMPLGAARYLDVSFLYDHALSLVNAGLITVLVIAGSLRTSRFAYLGALLAMHLQYVGRYSLGKVAHGSQFTGLALLAVAAATLAFRHRRYVRRTALGLCCFFFGLGYTTAAFAKLIGTGPHWIDGRHLWLWIHERTVDTFSLTGELSLNPVQHLVLEHYAIATAILAAGLVTELFGFALWFKRSRPLITTLLLAMHVGILVIMKISFSSNVCLLILVGYPWQRVIDAALRRTRGRLPRPLRRMITPSPR